MHVIPHCTTAPMHKCMVISYACSWHFKEREERNPNLPCEGQTKKEHGRRRLIGMKTGQNRSILCKQNKETEAKRVRLGFLGTSMHVHT